MPPLFFSKCFSLSFLSSPSMSLLLYGVILTESGTTWVNAILFIDIILIFNPNFRIDFSNQFDDYKKSFAKLKDPVPMKDCTIISPIRFPATIVRLFILVKPNNTSLKD